MEATQEQLFNGMTFDEKIKSLSPMYAVVCVNSDGTLSGLVENSFSLDKHENRVNIFWTSTARGIDGKSWAAQNCNKSRGWFMVELNTEDCPIEVDWMAWLNATYKFTMRNALFKMREGFDFSAQMKEAAARENYDAKHSEIMKSVSVFEKADEIYQEKVRAAQKVFDTMTVDAEAEFKKLRNKYQSKAKSIAIERGKCPKLPDGRYMNTGNCRITSHGIQLKWFATRPIVYTVPWKDLF